MRSMHLGGRRRAAGVALVVVGLVAAVGLTGCDTTTDTDGDGIPDFYERFYRWDVDDPDQDDDGTLDGEQDHDLDGLTTSFEVVDHPAAHEGRGLDPTDADSDDDGLTDGFEVPRGLDALQADMDEDGLIDSLELSYGTDVDDPDFDGDGLLDGEEHHVYGTQPQIWDSDFDGLNDGREVLEVGTDPNEWDTDGDTWSDGDEVFGGTDPFDPTSHPEW